MKKQTSIIAEIGMNHNGSLDKAKKIVDAAAGTGVQIVKFQTHLAEHETLPSAPAPKYFTKESRWDFFKRTAFSLEQHKELKQYVESKNIEFISSAFSHQAVDLLEQIGVKTHKVPSGETTNLPLIEYMAKTKKNILLSTGMSDWEEIDTAVETITKWNNNLTILQCTSSYPSEYNEVGINVMLEMADRYKIPVGLSDHTLDLYASFAATALGASVIERHFTISKTAYGPDAKFSLDPFELKTLVQGVQAISQIINSKVDKNDVSKFKEMKTIFEKSIVAANDLKKGTVLTINAMAFKKPGDGIKANKYQSLLNKTLTVDIKKDTPFSIEMLE